MRTLATGALVVIVAACSSAATPAPTTAPTTAPSVAASAAASAAATQAAAPTLSATGDKVTIKMLNGWAPDSVFAGPVRLLLDALKTGANGRITITQAGPEVVPPTEQFTAVKNGVYDMLYTVPLYYTGVKAEGEALYFISGNSSCAAYRAAGALAPYEQAHLAGGVQFLGCGGGGAHGATFLLKKPITSIDEFKGMKFRGFGLYTRVLDALGATSVTIAAGDVYSAVERGVVDGAAFPNLGVIEFGLSKVTPYIVMPPYLPFRYNFLVNPAAFNAMPKDVQAYLKATIDYLEGSFNKYFVDARDKEAVQLKAQGTQELRLSTAESTRLDKLIHTELWKYIVEKSPTYGPQIQAAFEKIEPPTK